MPHFRRFLFLSLLFAFATAAGFAGAQLGMPLAWMVGSMVASAAAAMVFDIPEPPRVMRELGQVVIGGAVGLTLTPDAAQRILFNGVPIAVSAACMIGAAWIIATIQTRLTGLSRATTIFTCVPGSPVEMAILARRFGGDPAKAAFAQMVRLFCILIIIPPLIMWQKGTVPIPIGTAGPPDWPMMGILFVLSCAFGLVAKGIRLANPFFLGPMAGLGMLVGGFGFQFATYHQLVFAAAQIMLGVSIGAMFRRDFLTAAPRFLLEVVCTTLILLVVGACLSWFLTHTAGIPFDTLILSNAPGGITELALTSKALGLDVSLVVAFHLFRVLATVLFLPLAYQVFIAKS